MRFRAIDTFRGLAAILVILFHIPDSTLLKGNQVISHGYIAVDFFFVLSGFVMAHSYLNKINDVPSAKSFVIKRFKRIYPLHLFTLLVFLAFETGRFIVNGYFVKLSTPPFDNCSVATFIANLTLTHSMGLFDHLSWNLPSWSISVEFYAYIAWAIMLIAFRKKLWLIGVFSLPFIVWFVWKFNGNMEYTYDYGFIRCMFGFLLGMYAYLFASKLKRKIDTRVATITEIGLLGLTGYFLSVFNTSYHWIMPFWFAIIIIFFSTETGSVAKLFAHSRLKFLGELSFSYYLNHIVIIRVFDLLFFKVIKLNHSRTSDAVFLLFVFSTVQVVSMFTYKYVELRFLPKPKTQPKFIPQAELVASAP
jgi:peptidoglycan/LPS O-acetylase OafA/YrhL